ncbi:MAG: hypothetical protein R3Y28_04660 [Candidatus Gastranaerophilales bacterium]
MIDAIKNVICSPNLTNIAQNTASSVSIETTLKAAGRPAFIMMDKDIDDDTKKYAATKEFLYQATCLAVYLTLITQVFKKGGFQLAKNKLFKNTEGFEHFKNVKEYNDYRKLADKSKENRLATLSKKLDDGTSVKDKYNDTLVKELNKDEPEKFHSVKGSIELSNIVGSVLGLAVLAPQVSHAIIHPAMRVLGMEEKNKPDHTHSQKKMDTQA